MKPFKHRMRGGVFAQFEPHEARMIANLAAQLIELLRDGEPESRPTQDPLEALLDTDGPSEAPDDPVLARLLPDAYRDDDEGAGDFRRYTERGLRDGKSDNASEVIASLVSGGLDPTSSAVDDTDAEPVEVELDQAGVAAWLRCLTDLRLAMGTRLGVEQDDEERWNSLPADDPDSLLHDVYDWLAYVQETLIHATQ